MAKPFSVETEESRFRLPRATREQIQALILDLDLDARNVIIRAVAELWQKEIGTPDRDIYAEIDALKAAVAAMSAAPTAAQKEE